ncbi:hypothetical protein [Chitinophaga sancti]|uniref:hypothetical protein n=1 Tax=Chitinophaga sancti TaxID=1004 RepID=UPI003F7ACF0C
MQSYRIRILHPNAMTRLRMQPAMHGLIGILFLLITIGVYNRPDPNWAVAGLFFLLGIGSLVFPFMMKRFKNIQSANSLARTVQAFACLTGCLFVLTHMQPLAAGFLFLTGVAAAYIGYAEYKIFMPSYIRVDLNGATLPTTFSEKVISWSRLNNLILRNDLLTIDFKDNKVLQLEVLDEPGADKEAEMNAFFKSRL